MVDWKLKKKKKEQNGSVLAESLRNADLDLVPEWRAGLCVSGQLLVTGAGCSGSSDRSIREMLLPQLGTRRQTAQEYLCVDRCTRACR